MLTVKLPLCSYAGKKKQQQKRLQQLHQCNETKLLNFACTPKFSENKKHEKLTCIIAKCVEKRKKPQKTRRNKKAVSFVTSSSSALRR